MTRWTYAQIAALARLEAGHQSARIVPDGARRGTLVARMSVFGRTLLVELPYEVVAVDGDGSITRRMTHEALRGMGPIKATDSLPEHPNCRHIPYPNVERGSE